MFTLLSLFACGTQPSDDSASAHQEEDSSTGEPGDSDSGEPDDTGDTAAVDPCLSLPTDDPCCVESTDTLLACSDFDDTVTGVFTPGDDDGAWVLTEDDGTRHSLWLTASGAGATLLPDLATMGTVTVTDPGCGLDGESYSPGDLTILGPDGELLFAVGTAGAEEVGAVTLSAGPSTCPDRPPSAADLNTSRCFETVQNYPVEFTDGATTLSLYQGESGEIGGVEVTVFLAMFPGESTYQCSDVAGNLTDWVMVGA